MSPIICDVEALSFNLISYWLYETVNPNRLCNSIMGKTSYHNCIFKAWFLQCLRRLLEAISFKTINPILEVLHVIAYSWFYCWHIFWSFRHVCGLRLKKTNKPIRNEFCSPHNGHITSKKTYWSQLYSWRTIKFLLFLVGF